MNSQIAVKVHGTDDKPGASIDDYIGATAARAGQPVEVRIARGNQTQILHLSFGEATQLCDALAAARIGRQERLPVNRSTEECDL